MITILTHNSKMSTTAIATVISAVLLLVMSPSMAEIKTFTITSDTRPTILFHSFGFTNTGHLAIAVSSVSVAAAPPQDPSRMGLVLLNGDSFRQVITETEQNLTLFCFLDSHYIMSLFTFRDLPPLHAPFNGTYHVTSPSEYSLFFANCNSKSSVSMTVHTEFFNFDNDFSRNYLSSGHTKLPFLFFFLFPIAYFSFLAFWLYLCHVSKHPLHLIHLLMAFLLLAKAFSIVCAAAEKHYVKVTGTAHGCDVLFFIFDFLGVVLLFTVVVLVGTSWNFLHPLVKERGNKVLLVLIPFQVLKYVVAYVVIHNTGLFIEDLGTWNQVLLILDFIPCCDILWLIVWSITWLTKITSKVTQGDPAILNLNKFCLLRMFYLAVISYLFLTRFVIFVLKTVVSGEYQWVSNLVEETVTLVFCILMFYVFSLLDKDEYSVIGDEDEDATVIVVKE